MSTTTLGQRVIARLKSFVESVDPKKEVTMKMSKLVRAKFRVKIKSLAEEARIIRAEERRMVGQKWDCDRGCLHDHRKRVVGSEQRATLLAYALLRGKAYRTVESTLKPVDIKAVSRIAKSLAWQEVDVESWVAAQPDKVGV